MSELHDARALVSEYNSARPLVGDLAIAAALAEENLARLEAANRIELDIAREKRAKKALHRRRHNPKKLKKWKSSSSDYSSDTSSMTNAIASTFVCGIL